MIPRPFIIASLLGGAIGVPYLASRAPQGAPGNSGTSAARNFFAAAAAPFTATPNAPAPLGSALPHLASYPAIEQVLRFDITKEWVYRQWARKSTWPTDVGLYGVRVQLVTGTGRGALAGSLTYFFNAHEQVEHISFHGRTGDPTPLAAFLARTYEFQPAVAPPGEQLYQVMRGSRVHSELRSRPDAVSTSASPQSGFAVELELARPNSQRLLPPRAVQLAVPPASATAGAYASGSPADASEDSTLKKTFGSYFDKTRYATPEEEGQVLWKRWPN